MEITYKHKELFENSSFKVANTAMNQKKLWN